MGKIEEKFEWDGQLPKPSNMKFSYEDANALSEGAITVATKIIAPSNSENPTRADISLPGTSDQIKVQEIIDELSAGHGGSIYFLDGTCYFSDELFPKANVDLYGSGINKTIFESVAEKTMFKILEDNITLKNFTIDGKYVSGTSYAKSNIYCNGSNVIIKDIESKYAKTSGISIMGGENVILQNISAHHAFNNGISIVAGTDVTLHTCFAYDNLNMGVDIEPNNITDITKNIILDDLHVYDNLIGVHMINVPGSTSQYNATLTNSFMNDNVQGLYLKGLINSKVSNCYINHNSADGIEINDVLNCTIQNCNIFHNGWHGIELRNDIATIDSRNLKISDCNSYNNSDGTHGYGAGLRGWNGTYKTYGLDIERCNFFDDQAVKTQHAGVNFSPNTFDDVTAIFKTNRIYGNSSANIIGTVPSCAYQQHVELFMDVQGISSTYIHAAITGTGAEQEITTGITHPDVPRNIRITTTNVASPSGNVAIEGTTATNETISEDIAIVPGGTGYGGKAFGKVTKIIIPSTVSASDTVSIGIANRIGLANSFIANSDVFKVKGDNADITYTVSPGDGTVYLASLAGGKDYTIWYKEFLNFLS